MTQPFRIIFALIVAAVLVPAASAQVLVYSVALDGPSEFPPNASPGSGSAIVTFDTGAHTMRVEVTFSGLTGTTTASHIHAPTAVAGTGTAGVATTTPTFTGFPLGVTSGTYDHTFDLTQASSFNASFVTAHGGTASSAETDFLSYVDAGKAYLNIHTNTFGGGEIRGFLTPVAIPEPSTYAAFAGSLILAGTIWSRRRRDA